MSKVSIFRAAGTPAANQTYDCTAGVAGVVALPDGAYLTTCAAWSSAAGATMQIGAKPAVSIPTGGAFEQDVDGGIIGPLNITFVGTSQYFVDWVL
jgi:hypothetical protein